MCGGGGFFGGVMLLALGFIVLHYADKDKSKYLKIAGYILAVFGGLSLFYAAYMRFAGSCDAGGHRGMHSPCADHGNMMPGKGMMGSGGEVAYPGMGTDAMMKFSANCIKEMNGKTINADGMNKFHECMMKTMPGKMASSHLHKMMMENMAACSSKFTGKMMDANNMLEMHNCMMQGMMEDDE